jgi:hypothetical protein
VSEIDGDACSSLSIASSYADFMFQFACKNRRGLRSGNQFLS